MEEFTSKNQFLPVKSDILSSYLAQIEKLSLLTPEEEHRLALLYKTSGDTEAAHKLVTSNLRFVVMVALEYRHYGMKIMDLVQEGNFGLMMAVKKFDPYKGYRLITYAVWWIRAYILSYVLRNWSLVKVGTTQEQRKLFFKLGKLRKLLENTSDKKKSKIIKELGIDEAKIEELENRYTKRDVSLDAPLSADAESTHLDILSDPNADMEAKFISAEKDNLLKAGIALALEKLDDKEKYIVENRYLTENPQTLQEIGDKIHLSRERIRQLESRAIKKLRVTLKKYGFHTDAISLPVSQKRIPALNP
ncbi:MAG TPA: RNA polymerase factor sigma-32 [bacterium]